MFSRLLPTERMYCWRSGGTIDFCRQRGGIAGIREVNYTSVDREEVLQAFGRYCRLLPTVRRC